MTNDLGETTCTVKSLGYLFRNMVYHEHQETRFRQSNKVRKVWEDPEYFDSVVGVEEEAEVENLVTVSDSDLEEDSSILIWP